MSDIDKQLEEAMLNDQLEEAMLSASNPNLTGGGLTDENVSKAIPFFAKGLDVTSAPVRAAASRLLGVNKKGEGFGLDLLNPQINVPPFSEILARKGVPEGALISEILPSSINPYKDSETAKWYQPEKGGIIDPTVRGTVGTALDLATDPTMWASLGSKSLVKETLKRQGANIAKKLPAETTKSLWGALKETGLGGASQLTTPISTGLEYIGNKIYRSGLKPVDTLAAKLGKEPISPILMDRNLWGFSENIYKDVNELQAIIGAKAREIAFRANKAGITIDMNQAMKMAEEEIALLAKRPSYDTARSSLSKSIDAHKARGQVPMTEAVTMKSDLYDTSPDELYEASKRTPGGAQVQEAMSRGIRQANENAADTLQEGLGQKLKGINSEWGNYLTARDALEGMSGKAVENMATLQGVAKIGVGATNPMSQATMIASLLRATPVKTGLGLGLTRAFGNMGPVRPASLLDSWIKRKLIQDQQEKYSPWSLMRGQE